MRLWHEDLIPYLPRQQLLGQHRECCALRGNGWGKPHATVNYVFEHPAYMLYQYHVVVMDEMTKRGFKHDPLWDLPLYRGKSANPYEFLDTVDLKHPIYAEHDQFYLDECVDNLRQKGIIIDYSGD
ncbi:TIGR02328 family protein [Culicoidibacter larvae]|uniref:Pyrimidine dimer DNA glycosylase n=1 Tax=Culicoidibacter larvae TaxID=2579976 RepID=A0A5R8QG35_9FIRM|nr:TIGR02328 family protein [Culicoidibacter larvae]TLG75443.1 hypothetical protein FEZ08_05185 [Culicoidibacter larvae]